MDYQHLFVLKSNLLSLRFGVNLCVITTPLSNEKTVEPNAAIVFHC